jgi:hypothetical protein
MRVTASHFKRGLVVPGSVSDRHKGQEEAERGDHRR